MFPQDTLPTLEQLVALEIDATQNKINELRDICLGARKSGDIAPALKEWAILERTVETLRRLLTRAEANKTTTIG